MLLLNNNLRGKIIIIELHNNEIIKNITKKSS